MPTADNPDEGLDRGLTVDPVLFYFVGGLTAGVLGSFVAARLLRVDRLWSGSGKLDPVSVVTPLVQAAKVYAVTGPSGLVNIAGAAEYPLLRYALCQVIDGKSPEEVRTNVYRRLDRMHRVDRRYRFAGRLLGSLSPVLGITGMAGAMYLGLSRLNDPTGSASGLAICVLLLMVGGNLIAMFGRRLSAAPMESAVAGQVAGAVIAEGTALIRSGATAQEVAHRARVMLGEEPPTAELAKAA
ncbi:MAG: hypothetical protein QM783_14440 [Phycisphaerales bacterium]